MLMPKCTICKQNEATWTWQPFGPDESPNLFVLPGNHYRGFVAIKVCDNCKEYYQSGNLVKFTYKNLPFIASKNRVYKDENNG